MKILLIKPLTVLLLDEETVSFDRFYLEGLGQ